MSSYISTKIKVRDSDKSGKGIFVIKKINKGEIVGDYTYGFGKYINTVEADKLYEKGLDHMIQIGNDLFFAATNENEFEEADLFNHSCEPNCGIKDRLKIVAMRDIEIGEEATVDYAMMESSEYSFKCNCGAQNCRKIVSGNDWKIPRLQQKYKGYFSDYLQNRINKLSKQAV